MLIWFMGTWMLKKRYCYDWCLMDTTWNRVKGNNGMISYTKVISVRVSYSTHWCIALFLCYITHFSHILWTISSWTLHIYSIDILLYLYALPIITSLTSFSSLCLSCNLSLAKGCNSESALKESINLWRNISTFLLMM